MKKSLILPTFLMALTAAASAAEKSLIDYYLPMEPQGPLMSEGTWGDPNVLPRDVKNGLEDATLENWCYWDGKIVKGDDGCYHMYASRWSQTFSHKEAWHVDTKGVHAVSDKAIGPYKDTGLLWPQWKGGLGHNVVGLRMHDGRYAALTSEVSSGQVFVSDTPEGPFELLGDIKVDPNGFDPVLARYDENNRGAVKSGTVGFMANVQIMIRPDDGRYMVVPRSCAILISDDGILGPYKIVADRAYKGISDLPQEKMEDPTCWYSGGMYHIMVNHWKGHTSYHLTSEDGISNWKNRGVAFKHDADVFKYTDGTVNNWTVVQRPTAFVEDGHVTHFNFSVIDSTKGGDQPNDQNGSKIVVVPFDGVAFDRDIRAIVDAEKAAALK